jgi:ATP-binding cassette, subfamily B (MDR/TAP), member 1
VTNIKISVVLSSLSSFFSGFIIGFVRNWKLALILSCIIPTIMAIFGVGGGFIAKFATLVVKEYAVASTIAEEVISSVRTVQAFGTEEKLAKLYDDNLVQAQRVGYRQQISGAVMLSTMMLCVYMFYGLGFCISIFYLSSNHRGGRAVTCCRRFDNWHSVKRPFRHHHWCLCTGIHWSPN